MIARPCLIEDGCTAPVHYSICPSYPGRYVKRPDADDGAAWDANRRILKHEAETPMRGHDEDGACCRRAKFGADQ